jgi:hypothetical protein
MSHGPFDQPKGIQRKGHVFTSSAVRTRVVSKREREPRALSAKGKGRGKDRKRSRGVKDLRTFPAGMFSLIPGFLGGGASIFLPFRSCSRVLVSRTWKWKWKWVWQAKMVEQTTNRCSLSECAFDRYVYALLVQLRGVRCRSFSEELG